jgi:hypothetical protein
MKPLFPTAYFGSIAYFQLLLRYDSAVIEVCDTFPKQTFRNRCAILTPQGEQRLSLPVEKPNGSKSLTQEIRVIDKPGWKNDHWRAIQSAYAHAPYFEHYAPVIHELIFHPDEQLVAYNSRITTTIARLFDCEITLETSTNFEKERESDFRGLSFDSPSIEGFQSIPYTQVLFDRPGFSPNPSILDLLFCDGPLGRKKLVFV